MAKLDPRNTDLRDPRVTPWIPTPPTEGELQVQRDLATLRELEHRRTRGPWYVWVPRDLFAALRDVFVALRDVFALNNVRVPEAVIDVFVPLFFVAALIFGYAQAFAGNSDRAAENRVRQATLAVEVCERARDNRHALRDSYMDRVDTLQDRAEKAPTKRIADRNWDRADELLEAAEALTIPMCERQRDTLTEAEEL